MSKKPTLNSEEAINAIQELLPDLMVDVGENNLSGIDGVLDRLGGIVAASEVDISHFQQQLSGIKKQSLKAQHHIANVDAAMWKGDMQRVEQLQAAGPGLDFAAMGVAAPPELQESDKQTALDETATILAEWGLDTDNVPLAEDIIPDRYADIAAGVPGAIPNFIATGKDPNEPTGQSQHTAFLAALDAPGRHIADLQALVAAGADPSLLHAFGDTSLAWAVGYLHPSSVTVESERAIVDFLVSHGADLKQDVPEFGNIFCRAVILCGRPTVEALLSAGCEIEDEMPFDFCNDMLAGASIIIAAAPKPEVVRLLLDHGIDPRKAGSNGKDPLEFVDTEAVAARARAHADDPWTVAHANALEETYDILRECV